jgi:hypothetical protein
MYWNLTGVIMGNLKEVSQNFRGFSEKRPILMLLRSKA